MCDVLWVFFVSYREKLEPEPIAPSFSKRMYSQDVLLGAQAKFSCKVTGEPRPTITW